MANLNVLAVNDGRVDEFEAENAELREQLARLKMTTKNQKTFLSKMAKSKMTPKNFVNPLMSKKGRSRKQKKKKAPGQIRDRVPDISPAEGTGDLNLSEVLASTSQANPLMEAKQKTFVRHTSKSGREYFFDPVTKETLWKEDLPQDAHVVQEHTKTHPEPHGVNTKHARNLSFHKHQSIDGRKYFSNTVTNETVWELPEGAVVI